LLLIDPSRARIGPIRGKWFTSFTPLDSGAVEYIIKQRGRLAPDFEARLNRKWWRPGEPVHGKRWSMSSDLREFANETMPEPVLKRAAEISHSASAPAKKADEYVPQQRRLHTFVCIENQQTERVSRHRYPLTAKSRSKREVRSRPDPGIGKVWDQRPLCAPFQTFP
jgi:hypothetical protein